MVQIKKPILQDVTLCAIVRDEKMNPAGGIVSFIKSHVPFIEKAVIVDTGSIDGTKKLLEEQQKIHKNLRLFDISFRGFGDARNYSISKAKTKYVLILDADELLTHKIPTNDFKIISNEIQENPEIEVFSFGFEHVFPPSSQKVFVGVGRKRLFTNSKDFYFEGDVWESFGSTKSIKGRYDNIKCFIKHFMPHKRILDLKEDGLYNPMIGKIFHSPPTLKGYKEWKNFNLKRLMYN